MKFKEINELNVEELKKKMVEVQMELMKLNAQVATGTAPKNPNQVKQMKKTIAKIKTAMKQKANTKEVAQTNE